MSSSFLLNHASADQLRCPLLCVDIIQVRKHHLSSLVYFQNSDIAARLNVGWIFIIFSWPFVCFSWCLPHFIFVSPPAGCWRLPVCGGLRSWENCFCLRDCHKDIELYSGNKSIIVTASAAVLSIWNTQTHQMGFLLSWRHFWTHRCMSGPLAAHLVASLVWQNYIMKCKISCIFF